MGKQSPETAFYPDDSIVEAVLSEDRQIIDYGEGVYFISIASSSFLNELYAGVLVAHLGAASGEKGFNMPSVSIKGFIGQDVIYDNEVSKEYILWELRGSRATEEALKKVKAGFMKRKQETLLIA